jgi:hypothetical protein
MHLHTAKAPAMGELKNMPPRKRTRIFLLLMVASACLIDSTSLFAAQRTHHVTGVFCKKYSDLRDAILSTNVGVFLPDAIKKRPQCLVVQDTPVSTKDVFVVGWVPAAIVRVMLYEGVMPHGIVTDEGTLLPESHGRWFFSPRKMLPKSIPPKRYPVVPVQL